MLRRSAKSRDMRFARIALPSCSPLCLPLLPHPIQKPQQMISRLEKSATQNGTSKCRRTHGCCNWHRCLMEQPHRHRAVEFELTQRGCSPPASVLMQQHGSSRDSPAWMRRRIPRSNPLLRSHWGVGGSDKDTSRGLWTGAVRLLQSLRGPFNGTALSLDVPDDQAQQTTSG